MFEKTPCEIILLASLKKNEMLTIILKITYPVYCFYKSFNFVLFCFFDQFVVYCLHLPGAAGMLLMNSKLKNATKYT